MNKKKGSIEFSRQIISIIWKLRVNRLRSRLKRIHFVEEDGVYKATMGKKAWYIPSNDRTQFLWALNFIGTHERYLDALQEGDTIIEVGAATGEYTIPAAKKIGENGQIHAFEVEPVNYLCLKKNLALNNIENVKPVNKAVSDRSNKSLRFLFTKGGLSGGSLQHDHPEKDKISVKTISCDDYVTSIGLEKVDVLKITVNGHEPEVVEGAKNLLKGMRIVTFQSARHQEVIHSLSKEGFSLKKSLDAATNGVKVVLMEKG